MLLLHTYVIIIDCGNTLDTLGSGAASLVCGMNSECVNEAICQCEDGYFSVSTNHTDCQSRSGNYIMYVHWINDV